MIERFELKVDKSNDCWQWVASTDRSGYGLFWHESRMKYAHRVYWELTVGPIPNGMELDHLCMNKGCVNPAHLEPVSHAINVRRAKAVTTACPQGHPYNGDNLRITKRGHRRCRACHLTTANSARDRRRKETKW